MLTGAFLLTLTATAAVRYAITRVGQRRTRRFPSTRGQRRRRREFSEQGRNRQTAVLLMLCFILHWLSIILALAMYKMFRNLMYYFQIFYPVTFTLKLNYITNYRFNLIHTDFVNTLIRDLTFSAKSMILWQFWIVSKENKNIKKNQLPSIFEEYWLCIIIIPKSYLDFFYSVKK